MVEILTAILTNAEGETDRRLDVQWRQSQLASRLTPSLPFSVFPTRTYSCEVRIKEGEDGGFVAYVARLPGVYGQGTDADAAKEDVERALEAALRTYVEEQMPIPWRRPERKRGGEECVQVLVNA